MSADGRSVATDALATLGTIISDAEKRDAIHLAVEPVIAAETLHPGQDIGLVNGKAARCAHPLGIVDPFLKMPVLAGERFWLVVYPRQIRSLRHVWEHPDFPSALEPVASAPVVDGVEASRQWIRNFAESVGLGSSTVIDGARDWVASYNGKWGEEYLCFGGLLEGESVPDEFWPHYERVTGESVPDEKRGSFFTCSC